METNVRFNVNACLNYIGGIENFTIEFESKPSYDEISETMMYVAEGIEVKSFLKTFVMKCKKEAMKEEYDFVKWLRGRRRHWKVQQYQVVGCLNDRLAVSEADDKAVLEKRMRRYLDFFQHNCRLIEMMLGDVMNNFSQASVHGIADNCSVPQMVGKELQQDTYINSFEQLFKKGEPVEPYFQLLRDHEYPLIGNDYNYVSKALKSGFCIWIYELQRRHIIEHQPDKVYAKLLLSKISGLRAFDVSLFRKTNNKAEERYGDYFRTKIRAVKNSQVDAHPTII
jgi:hypothetical protein